jgi:RND family efflux transporter MFP subunit
VAGLLLIAGVVTLGFLIKSRGEAASFASATDDEQERPRVRVQVRAPEKKTIRRTVRLPADILALQDAPVHARVAGYVKEIPVDIGSRVNKEALLVLLSVPDLDAQESVAAAKVLAAGAAVLEAKAGVVIAKTNIAAAEAEEAQAAEEVKEAEAEKSRAEVDLDYRKTVHERTAKVRATSPNLVSEEELDETLARYAMARADLRLAEARLGSKKAKAAFAAVKSREARNRKEAADIAETAALAMEQEAKAFLVRAKAEVGFARITAPFDGVVVERRVDVGALVQNAASGGSSRPILRVVDDRKMRIRFRVAEPDAPACVAGRTFVLAVDELPGVKLPEGKVARVAESLDLEVRTMVVEGEIDNADRRLRAGMFGRVTLDLEEHKDALVVPALAVTTVKRKSSVLLVEEGKVVKRAIKTGADNGIEVQVLEGLDGKEDVIVAGGSLVSEGDRVEAVREGPR